MVRARKRPPRQAPATGQELYNIDRKPKADGLARFRPAMTRLSRPPWAPPLPGDLGPAELRARKVWAYQPPERRRRTTRRARKSCARPSWRARPTKANVFFPAGASHAGGMAQAALGNGEWQPDRNGSPLQVIV